jgi:hypothetical protein
MILFSGLPLSWSVTGYKVLVFPGGVQWIYGVLIP